MELLTREGAATRLHVEQDVDGTWVVWLDTDIDERDGICIGIGADRASALADAYTELSDRLTELKRVVE